jgi:hypothetical protein
LYKKTTNPGNWPKTERGRKKRMNRIRWIYRANTKEREGSDRRKYNGLEERETARNRVRQRKGRAFYTGCNWYTVLVWLV